MHYFNLLLTQILQCNIDLAKSNIDPPVCNIAFDKSKPDPGGCNIAFDDCNIAFGKSKHENLKTNMRNIKTILLLWISILLLWISILLLRISILLLRISSCVFVNKICRRIKWCYVWWGCCYYFDGFLFHIAGLRLRRCRCLCSSQTASLHLYKRICWWKTQQTRKRI